MPTYSKHLFFNGVFSFADGALQDLAKILPAEWQVDLNEALRQLALHFSSTSPRKQNNIYLSGVIEPRFSKHRLEAAKEF